MKMLIFLTVPHVCNHHWLQDFMGNISLVPGDGDGIFELEEDRSLTGMSRVSIKLLDDDLLTNPQYSLEVSLVFIYANLMIKIGQEYIFFKHFLSFILSENMIITMIIIIIIIINKTKNTTKQNNSKLINYQLLNYVVNIKYKI